MGKLMAKPGLKLLIQTRFGTMEEFAERIGYSRQQLTTINSGKGGTKIPLASIIANELEKEVDELFYFEPFFKPYLLVNFKKKYESFGYTEETVSEALGLTVRSLKRFRIGKVPMSLKLARTLLRVLKMDDDIHGKDFYDMFDWCYKDKDGNLIVGGDFDAKKNN